MDPPNPPTKPDLHPILARRYFDKLEDQSMRTSSVSDKIVALEARERQITRDRRDNEAVAADLLRRERSVIEVERRLEKREKEIGSHPTREEVDMLETQLAEAMGKASHNKHKFYSAVDEHNYLAKKYHNAKREHEKTKRDFGGEIVRLGKVVKNLQERLSETERKLGEQRLENLELKMRNAEWETRNEFLEKEYRRRLSGSEEKAQEEKEEEKKTHRRRPSRIPIATKEKKPDENIPISHFAKSTVASRARAVSSSPPSTTEKREAAAANSNSNEQNAITNCKPSGPRNMPCTRAVSIASAPDSDSAESSFTALPPPASRAFTASLKSEYDMGMSIKPTPEPQAHSSSSSLAREAMTRGYYSAADLLSRGPPVPPHAPPAPITTVAANTARKITSSNTTTKPRPRPASIHSISSKDNEDDIAYPHSTTTLNTASEANGAKNRVKKKYSQDFRAAVERSLPWLRKETQKVYSEAFL